MSERIFGIDLGTTNSCLAVMETMPRAIAIDGSPLVPSVVGFDGDEVLVGRRARNRLVLEPESTVRSIKRRMGEEERLHLGGRNLLPEEIAAEILRYLKVEGGKAEGCEVRKVVITVPAYFEDAQRRATVRAGELAGLDVVRLINEPTAAALVYDRLQLRGVEGELLDRSAPRGERVLVYDLGGGTFDISVVEIRGEVSEVLASCGDNHLGGDDFDRLIVDHLLNELSRDLSGDVRAMARLQDAAERAKIDLSSRPYARVMEEALAAGVHLDHELSRDTFEELVRKPLESTSAEVDRALEESGLLAGQIDRVVLVGGSTRIPRVAEMLSERFEGPVEHSVDPALCVALGAALQGAVLGGQVFDHVLVDVAAHSLGVRCLGVGLDREGPTFEPDRFWSIIPRNTQIPVTRSEVFYTLVDEQEGIVESVYQGEEPLCRDNTLIGEFPFELEPAPANSPVVVELSYDLDGIVCVRVHQKGTENRKQVTLDTRRRGESGRSEAREPLMVDNYVLRKARRLAGELDEELGRRMLAAAEAYETALSSELAGEALDPSELDRLEDELLERLEEAEEALQAVGA